MLPRFRFVIAFLVAAVAVFVTAAFAASSDLPAITKMKIDLQNTGWNNNEKLLDVTNVNVDKFGKTWDRDVTGFPYGQVLYVPAVTTKTSGTRNLIFVVTMANIAYAFDADDPNESEPIWTQELGQWAPSYAGTCMAQIGAVATPVIDMDANIIYITAYHKVADPDQFQWRFHALDIRSGEYIYQPTVIQATFVNPDNPSQVLATFDAKNHIQRAALTLKDGIVWAPFSAYCDLGAYYGWLLGIDTKSGKVIRIWNSAPVDGEGGIWQSGQGITFDPVSGDIILATGNANTNEAIRSYGNSIVRISPNDVGPNNQLKVKDFFAPSNSAYLTAMDTDLGSCGTMMIPDSDSIIGGSKEPYVYNLDINSMGGFTGAGNADKYFQRVTLTGQHVHGTPVYWKDASTGNEYLYVWSESDRLKQFQYVRSDPNNKRLGKLSEKPVAVGSILLNWGDMPGGFMTVTSNGDKDGSAILWVNRPIGNANKAVTQGVLHAYDARNVSNELWNSEMNTARDKHGAHAKFVAPTAVAGRVYLATFNVNYNQDKTKIACKINAYGLLSYDYSQNPNLLAPDVGDSATMPPTASTTGGSNNKNDASVIPYRRYDLIAFIISLVLAICIA